MNARVVLHSISYGASARLDTTTGQMVAQAEDAGLGEQIMLAQANPPGPVVEESEISFLDYVIPVAHALTVEEQYNINPVDGLRALEFRRNVISNFDDRNFYPALGNKKIFIAAQYPNDGAPYGPDDTVQVNAETSKRFTVLPSGPVKFENGFAKFIIIGGAGVTPDEADPDKKEILKFDFKPGRMNGSVKLVDDYSRSSGVYIKRIRGK